MLLFRVWVLASVAILASVPVAEAQSRFDPDHRGAHWGWHPARFSIAGPPVVPDGNCPELLRPDDVNGWRPIPRSPITGQPLSLFYNSPTSASGLVRAGVRLMRLDERLRIPPARSADLLED